MSYQATIWHVVDVSWLQASLQAIRCIVHDDAKKGLLLAFHLIHQPLQRLRIEAPPPELVS